MDWAEPAFPQYFPQHQPDVAIGPFLARYYPSTGIYLGVVVSITAEYPLMGVYVLGGPFGGSPLYVGQLTDYITPSSPDPDPVVFPAVEAGKLYVMKFPSEPFNLVDKNSGVFTPQASIQCGGIAGASVGPDGVAIGSLSDGRIVQFDPVSGQCKNVFTAPEWLTVIAVAPDGTIVGQSQEKSFGAHQLYRFTPTGTLISKVPVASGENFWGMAFGPDGKLYGSGILGGFSTWAEINPATGQFTLKGSGAAISRVCIDSAGVAYGNDFGRLVRWNAATGAYIGSIDMQQDTSLGPFICR